MRCSPGVAAAVLPAVALILGASREPARAEGEHVLSMAEAVRTALANDAELYIAREDARVAADGIALARSPFTRRLFGELYATRNAQPLSATSFRAVDAGEERFEGLQRFLDMVHRVSAERRMSRHAFLFRRP